MDPLSTYELVGAFSFGKGLFRREGKPGSELGDFKFFALEPGDLVLSNIQAWEGAIALAGPEHRGLIGTHRFLSYIPRDDRIDTSWARWFFLSEPGMELIRRAAPGTAVRNRTLSMERFEALEISLPQIDQQRMVAHALEHLATRQREIAALSRHGQRRSAALIGSLTQSAEVAVPLGELLAQVKRGVKPAAAVEYKLLGVRWYAEGLFVRERKLGAESSASTLYRVEADDFVYNRLFAWKGSFAVAGPEVEGCYVSNEFPTFQVDDSRLDVRFLHALFRSPSLWSYVETKSTGGTPTSRNRFKEIELCEMAIPLPSLGVQLEIVRRVDTVLRISRLRADVVVRAEALVASALNKAFPHSQE